jgi:hypothetical protein
MASADSNPQIMNRGRRPSPPPRHRSQLPRADLNAFKYATIDGFQRGLASRDLDEPRANMSGFK